MAELTYHVERWADTYANILANSDQYQLGYTTNTFGSVGVADDLIGQNATGEHFVFAKQFQIANDDTTISYLSNNFGATTFHNTVTMINNTAENSDGGRESIIAFKGTQSGGSEETTLAKIQASHDGASDDEKGDLIFYTNDGSDSNTPTEAMRINSARSIKFSGLPSNNLEFVDVPFISTINLSGSEDGYILLDVADGTTRYLQMYSSIPE